MNPNSPTDELVDRLRRRWAFVEALDEGALDGPELVDTVGVSRSTVDRAVRELEIAGVVEYDSGGYRRTALGTLAAEAYESLAGTVTAARRLEPVLEWLPDGAPFDVDAFADADVVVSEPGDPYAMVNRHVRTLREADRIRAVTPVTGRHACEAIHESVFDGGSADLVVTPPVLETMRSPRYVDLLREATDTGRATVSRTDEPVPYYLGVLGGTAQVGVDGDGQPRALAESTAPEAVSWAERQFEHYRGEGEPVEF